jgi:hypothetical protein
MNFLNYEVQLDRGDVVVVTLDKQANVRLMDQMNFAFYERGQQYRYYGGLAPSSPAHIGAPGPGRWHVVIDLGGYPGTVGASVQVQRRNP